MLMVFNGYTKEEANKSVLDYVKDSNESREDHLKIDVDKLNEYLKE